MEIKDIIKELKTLENRVVVNKKAMKHLSCIYTVIWSEAYYDPYNEHVQNFAKKIWPHIKALNAIFKFKE